MLVSVVVAAWAPSLTHPELPRARHRAVMPRKALQWATSTTDVPTRVSRGSFLDTQMFMHKCCAVCHDEAEHNHMIRQKSSVSSFACQAPHTGNSVIIMLLDECSQTHTHLNAAPCPDHTQVLQLTQACVQLPNERGCVLRGPIEESPSKSAPAFHVPGGSRKRWWMVCVDVCQFTSLCVYLCLYDCNTLASRFGN